MNVPEAQHCMSCGTELGLQPIALELTADAQCPRCKAQRLDAFLGMDGEILDCATCGGQFVTAEVLQAMVHRYQNASLAVAPCFRARTPLEPIKYVHCPFCGDLMLRRNFGKVSGVVVDVCAKHGTWFDVGELARVLSFVGDGGLQRAAALRQQEQDRARASDLVHSAEMHWAPLSDTNQPQSMDWAEMREAARAFVGWVRDQLK
jgi:Zn-finger nucleic acid-binding protein